MLVLTRRAHERLFIGDDVVVSVIEVKGGRVTLGITAPKDMNIVREEVLDRQLKKELNRPEDPE